MRSKTEESSAAARGMGARLHLGHAYNTIAELWIDLKKWI